MIFAFFFSSACAGIWEIFEFTSDKLLGGGMQRGMEDTVTDSSQAMAGPCCTVSSGSSDRVYMKDNTAINILKKADF